jgi:hypothetical protein
MAVDLTLKSVQITNREASPRVLNNPGLGEGGTEKVAVGVLASVPASLSITSIIRMVTIPSNAVVTGVRLSSGAQTAGAFDISVYRTNADGGAVATNGAAFFASAVSCASAVVNADELNESTNNTLAKQAQPLWQALGYTKDPECMFDICCVVATTDVTTGTGALLLRVQYTQ